MRLKIVFVATVATVVGGVVGFVLGRGANPQLQNAWQTEDSPGAVRTASCPSRVGAIGSTDQAGKPTATTESSEEYVPLPEQGLPTNPIDAMVAKVEVQYGGCTATAAAYADARMLWDKEMNRTTGNY